ncbi:MAG: GNAT family N-acetyltransferase [Methylovulum sp.]|uniref:GNAT family N-acetyltransferase n=1 Tax=Methylovulum sp. TaxID=1916980 RepID=UPI002625490E|nr:GNAT family N-acetyltransferase [Methylovulum sp.]MDD2725077.1 GNAT family N-acetyltransferase [Methylovulum sp.]MDD5124126.1 GNAT family N-acetyltransferase [Methylovulum sp.]
MTTWKLLPVSAFSEYTGQWDALNQQLYQSHPLFDSRFVGALLKHFGNPQAILAVYPATAGHRGNLLLLEPRKLGVWGTFMPSQTQIAPLLCGYPEALPGLFAVLPGLPVMIDVLCQDPLYTFLTQSLDYTDNLSHALTINIDVTNNFADYWQQRPKNLRQNIRSYSNRLKKNGLDSQIKIVSNIEEMPDALARYGEIETSGWKGGEGTAIHASNLQGLFYIDVLKAFATTGQAEIIEFYINDQLAASRICLINTEMLITLKTTFNESFSFYSPSHLMLYLLIEREFLLKRVRYVEFYTNAKPEQLFWCTGQRPIEHLSIFRSATVQWMLRCLQGVKAKLAKTR